MEPCAFATFHCVASSALQSSTLTALLLAAAAAAAAGGAGVLDGCTGTVFLRWAMNELSINYLLVLVDASRLLLLQTQCQCQSSLLVLEAAVCSLPFLVAAASAAAADAPVLSMWRLLRQSTKCFCFVHCRNATEHAADTLFPANATRLVGNCLAPWVHRTKIGPQLG